MEDLILKLSAKEVNSKQFNGKNGGYDAYQVDKYLDLVVNDYISFEKFYQSCKNSDTKVNELSKTIEDLKNQLAELEYKNSELEEKVNDLQVNGSTESNLDQLKRISKLEKELYRLGKDPSKIK